MALRSSLQATGFSELELWRHWVQVGQFEGRAFRFTCDPYKRQEQQLAADVAVALSAASDARRAEVVMRA